MWQGTREGKDTMRSLLREIRGNSTQKEISELLGITQQQYSRMESGKSDILMKHLVRLSAKKGKSIHICILKGIYIL